VQTLPSGQDCLIEVRFPDADLPYLFVAALRRHVGDGALTSAFVMPSAEGPVVCLDEDFAHDASVQELITLLEGSIGAASSSPASGAPA
jgi:hypothetical protein